MSILRQILINGGRTTQMRTLCARELTVCVSQYHVTYNLRWSQCLIHIILYKKPRHKYIYTSFHALDALLLYLLTAVDR